MIMVRKQSKQLKLLNCHQLNKVLQSLSWTLASNLRTTPNQLTKDIFDVCLSE